VLQHDSGCVLQDEGSANMEDIERAVGPSSEFSRKYISENRNTKEKEPSGRAPNGSFPQLPVRDRFHRSISARPAKLRHLR
jgi:hypothetical protein